MLDSNRILLSIITPAYNASAFLPTLIASVEAASKETAVEWILVDDGSTDNTADIFRATLAKQPAWQLVQQTNGGVASARNLGLANARGKYVWFVDADDLVVPAAMAALLGAAATDVDLLSFQAGRFCVGRDVDMALATTATAKIYRLSKPCYPMLGTDWVSHLITQKDWKHYLWQYWYRRELLVQHAMQFRVGIIHEDIAFVTQAALVASSVLYVDTLAYHYRENPHSLSHHVDEAKLLDRIESYFVVLEQLRALNAEVVMPAHTRAQLEGEVIGQALQVFELAKQLVEPASRQRVLARCRSKRLAQRLFSQAHNVKRLRQVLVMWLKQSGLLPLGGVSAK
ncbi:MAG: glycosyltransferase [Burkholderiales bacterium]